MKNLSIFSLIIIFVFTSCYKDVDQPQELRTITEQPRTTGDSGLSGKVVLPNGDLLTDYSLVINGDSYTVENEYFYLELQNLKKQGQLIEVFQNGQLYAAAYPNILENDINQIEIQSLNDFTTINLEKETNTVTMGSNIELTVNKADLINKNSNNLALNAELNFQVISDASVTGQMIQAAYNHEGQLVCVDAEQIILIDANESGENVGLASEKLLNLQIAQSANKSLYSFNDEYGYWEFVTVITGAPIVLDRLDHLAIGNHQPGLYVEGLVEENQRPISYIEGMNSSSSLSNKMRTTVSGRWAGFVIEGEALNQQLLNPCGLEINQRTFSTEEVIDNELTTQLNSNESLYNLHSQVFDCDGELIERPAVVLVQGDNNNQVYVFPDKTIDSWVSVCNIDFKVGGYDLNTGEQGPVLNWNSGITDSLEYISSCQKDQNGYSYIKIRDQIRTYDPFVTNIDNGKTTISSPSDNVRISFEGAMEGEYQVQDVNIYINDEMFGPDGYYISCESAEQGCGINDFYVSHFEETADGWLRASFSGVLWMQTIEPALAGNFPIEGVILTKN